jgi:lipid A 3-O-deacylase
LSLDIELNAMYFQQEIQDAQGLNAGLLLRWHIIRKRGWSFFLDGGTGLLVSTQDVPADGSSVNFASQAGLGFTLDLGGDTRLLTGVRWHHISNARLYDTNPSRDSILIYAGLTFPF